MTAVCIPPCTQIKSIRRQWRWYFGESVSQDIFLKWSSCNYCTLYHPSYSTDLQQFIHDGVPEKFVIPVLWNHAQQQTAADLVTPVTKHWHSTEQWQPVTITRTCLPEQFLQLSNVKHTEPLFDKNIRVSVCKIVFRSVLAKDISSGA